MIADWIREKILRENLLEAEALRKTIAMQCGRKATLSRHPFRKDDVGGVSGMIASRGPCPLLNSKPRLPASRAVALHIPKMAIEEAPEVYAARRCSYYRKITAEVEALKPVVLSPYPSMAVAVSMSIASLAHKTTTACKPKLKAKVTFDVGEMRCKERGKT